jgi:hypothetical protein
MDLPWSIMRRAAIIQAEAGLNITRKPLERKLVIRCGVAVTIAHNQEMMRSNQRHASAAVAANPSGGIRIITRRLHDGFRGQPEILSALPMLTALPRTSATTPLLNTSWPVASALP